MASSAFQYSIKSKECSGDRDCLDPKAQAASLLLQQPYSMEDTSVLLATCWALPPITATLGTKVQTYELLKDTCRSSGQVSETQGLILLLIVMPC